jgi:hypothetical protein
VATEVHQIGEVTMKLVEHETKGWHKRVEMILTRPGTDFYSKTIFPISSREGQPLLQNVGVRSHLQRELKAAGLD